MIFISWNFQTSIKHSALFCNTTLNIDTLKLPIKKCATLVYNERGHVGRSAILRTLSVAFSGRGVRATQIRLLHMWLYCAVNFRRPHPSLKPSHPCISAILSADEIGICELLFCLVRSFLTNKNSPSIDDVLVLKYYKIVLSSLRINNLKHKTVTVRKNWIY